MSKRILLPIACLALLATTLPVGAQYFIQQGNALDANNRLNSGGINTPRPGYQPNTGNRLITGNVTQGASFQGYSPIRDANTFFLATPGGTNSITGARVNTGYLPSDRLTTFRRDSVGINEVKQFANLPAMAPQPYYSRSSTVADTGLIVRGLNQPGTSQLQSPYTPIQRDPYARPANTTDTSRNSLIGTPVTGTDTNLANLTTPGTGTALTGTVNSRLLRSPLFGGARVVPGVSTPKQPGQTGEPGADLAGTADLAERRLAQSVLARNDRSEQTLDRILGQTGTTRGQKAEAQALRTETDSERRLSRPLGATAEEPTAQQQAGGLARPMRSAAELARGSEAEQRAGSMRRGRAEVPEEPLSTFVGSADERLKGHLGDAERLLREQRYYDAARQYEMAHALDLKNPLPLFGQAMSLLAAGDYVSSANNLFLAIQSVGPGGTLKINLRQFIPDLQTLDKRRAFLEQQLDVYDDFRLRFLLGWTEYMSDMRDLGLTNMQKAAQAAPANMDSVRRFVDVLATQRTAEPATPATRPG